MLAVEGDGLGRHWAIVRQESYHSGTATSCFGYAGYETITFGRSVEVEDEPPIHTRSGTTVQEQQRLAVTVDFVVQVGSVESDGVAERIRTGQGSGRHEESVTRQARRNVALASSCLYSMNSTGARHFG